MKISAIKQQIKRADRYSVYGDGKYMFSLSELELINSGLRIGQELNDQEVRALRDQSILGKAYDRALNLISHRPRSAWELREYLNRKDYDEDVIAQTMERLNQRGYINDLDFARRWIESRRLLKSTSQRRLAAELRQKHIAADVIDQVLAADETDEHQVLRDLVARKRQQPKYQDNLKLMQYLSRQGFDYEAIRAAMADL